MERMVETPRERRSRLDHERYMRQRDERLRKAHDRYWADPEKHREYRRKQYHNRVLLAMSTAPNDNDK